MGRNGRKANGKWIDRWREGGVQHQRTFDRKADRDRFRDERRRRQQLGGLVADVLAADVTLGEFMEDYWRLYAIPNLERNTRDAYRQQWAKHLHPRVGGYRLRQLSGKVINRELVETMRNAGVGAPTIRKALAVLQSILSYAVAEERLEHNPVARVAKPSALRDREVPPIPPLVVERLRARLELRDATMISLLAYAGLRPQELLALKVDDVTERKLLVRRKVVDGELLPYTKTKRHRPVTLLAPALPQDVRSYMPRVGDPRRPVIRARRRSRAVAHPRLEQLAQARLSGQCRGGRPGWRGAIRSARLVRVAAGVGGPHDVGSGGRAGARRADVRAVLRADLRRLRSGEAHERRGGDPAGSCRGRWEGCVIWCARNVRAGDLSTVIGSPNLAL
jgi:integrase